MLVKNSRLLLIVVLLSTMVLGQVAYAQASGDCGDSVPQWVRDRQQYETSYVYVPVMTGNAHPIRVTYAIPQWAIDRQQYETAYVYMPSASDVQTVEIALAAPQWVRDRQQYETSYVYVLVMAHAAQPTEDVC